MALLCTSTVGTVVSGPLEDDYSKVDVDQDWPTSNEDLIALMKRFREPLRFGKRAPREPLRFGKKDLREPIRFGKRSAD